MSRRHTSAARAHYRLTNPDVYVTVAKAATLLGVTRPTVYAMIARGELKGDHVAGRLVVQKTSHAKLK